MIGRAVLTVVDADRMTQSIQVEALQDEVIDEFEHMEPYGFTSHPHPGAEAIIAALGGMREHSVAVVVGDKRYRLTGLDEGEVAIYTDENNSGGAHRIVMKRGREIEMRCGSSSIVMTPTNIRLSANRIDLN